MVKKAIKRAVDSAVASFTHEILGLANKHKVEFDYAGRKGGQAKEIKRSLRIDMKAAHDLLKK